MIGTTDLKSTQDEYRKVLGVDLWQRWASGSLDPTVYSRTARVVDLRLEHFAGQMVFDGEFLSAQGLLETASRAMFSAGMCAGIELLGEVEQLPEPDDVEADLEELVILDIGSLYQAVRNPIAWNTASVQRAESLVRLIEAEGTGLGSFESTAGELLFHSDHGLAFALVLHKHQPPPRRPKRRHIDPQYEAIFAAARQKREAARCTRPKVVAPSAHVDRSAEVAKEAEATRAAREDVLVAWQLLGEAKDRSDRQVALGELRRAALVAGDDRTATWAKAEMKRTR